jgi:hypothetical protein
MLRLTTRESGWNGKGWMWLESLPSAVVLPIKVLDVKAEMTEGAATTEIERPFTMEFSLFARLRFALASDVRRIVGHHCCALRG